MQIWKVVAIAFVIALLSAIVYHNRHAIIKTFEEAADYDQRAK